MADCKEPARVARSVEVGQYFVLELHEVELTTSGILGSGEV